MKIKILLFLIIIIVACKQEPNEYYTIITGKITNNLKGEVSIATYDLSFEKTLKIADDGTFTDTLIVKGKSYVLYDSKNPIFLHLESGYNININYDAKNFENSISITGKGSEVNNYLLSKRKIEKELFEKQKYTYSLNEENFKEKIKTVKQSQLTLLENTDGILEDFRKKERRNLNYNYLNYLYNYENAHKYFTKNSEFKVSQSFLEELEGFNYNITEDFKFSDSYNKLVTEYYSEKANDLVKKDSIERRMAYLKIVGDLDNEVIKNGLLFDHANFSMSYSKDIDGFYNSFIKSSSNEENNAIITEKYNRLQALNKGKPSPKFVNYVNYKGGTTSFDDLKGKYIYIDVWATWCGPCIAEIPSLKKVEAQFHDSNIQFVSISIDEVSDLEKWKTMIEEKELGGIQLLAENDWKSKFVTDYQIGGIPRFILIDPNGNIVEANAPRPSDSGLIELFTDLGI